MTATALETARRMLEDAAAETLPTPALDAIPSKFYDAFVLRGLEVVVAEPRRLLCSLTVPPRLLVRFSSLSPSILLPDDVMFSSSIFFL
jgi:acyl-coenzyme A thioesterase 13